MYVIHCWKASSYRARLCGHRRILVKRIRNDSAVSSHVRAIICNRVVYGNCGLGKFRRAQAKNIESKRIDSDAMVASLTRGSSLPFATQ